MTATAYAWQYLWQQPINKDYKVKHLGLIAGYAFVAFTVTKVVHWYLVDKVTRHKYGALFCLPHEIIDY